ncbi:MAG: 3-deoxy-manno-octulosonate cytidylyltransferase [Candidatus Wallbacteria bacterium]|nr:3-deoxy-manno-octulosonate cytidylyltransferase [Candidatus Wallbacteria bacterium]
MTGEKNNIAIIPARMASSRFPGKPMAMICGIPMIGHVYLRVKMCPELADVYVATCDQEIVDYIESIGGKAVMTHDRHERCSDRCAEALEKIEKASGTVPEIMVMIQGDEPLVRPEMITEAVTPMIHDPEILITNLLADLSTEAEFEDPNEVKVVVDENGNALYFSREPIPSRKKGTARVPMQKQVCIIPFRRDFLLRYTVMKPTPLEAIESVDMLRILEHGLKVRMVKTAYQSKAVDTAADLVVVEKLMARDQLFGKYGKILNVGC